jgi:hypothetical protein
VAAPVAGACAPWVTGDELPTTCCTDTATRTVACEVATDLLFRLSGRQYPGLCQRTVRPCGIGCGGWARWPSWKDAWWTAEQIAVGGGWTINPATFPGGTMPPAAGCAGACSTLSTVTLPGPVAAVTQVVVDGVTLSTSAYQVADYRYLQRIDGGRWPCTQDMDQPSSAAGTWQVTYTYGRLPDRAGIEACREYACEIAKHLCPGGSTEQCRLPARTRSVVRQGVSFDITSPLDFLDKGRTGIPTVDAWLVSVNPAGLQRRATVRRFDTARRGPLTVTSGGSSTPVTTPSSPGFVLDDLADVSTVGIAAGDILRYQDGLWVPVTWPGGDRPWTTIDASTALGAGSTDYRYIVDATDGPVTVTLPTAAGHMGVTTTFKRVNGGPNAVTVAGFDDETIDGATSVTLGSQWASVTVSSTNTNWLTL